jgi:hypothetical protein
MTKQKSKLGNLLLVGTAALNLAGCGGGTDVMPLKEADINGYHVGAVINSRRIINISDPSLGPNAHFRVYGLDRDIDGRFDEIGLLNIPKGHPLENYANLDSLESMWSRVVETKGEQE